MNFLAHIYLSGNSTKLMLGNFMGDYVKGHNFKQYEIEIQHGILLHRKIDFFTDQHLIVRGNNKLFAEKYHKYAGVITDIIYDHYLTSQWDKYSDIDYESYVYDIYKQLNDNSNIFPEEVKIFLAKLFKNNWFKLYSSIDGIKLIFQGMSKATSLPDETTYAMKVFIKNYDLLKEDFNIFFPQIIDYVETEKIKMRNEVLNS